MPEIYDVACHFDDIDIADAYTGTSAFFGQFSSFEESSPDGSVTKKRTLSVRPGTVIPTRRAISFFDEVWLVGDGNTDGIYNRQTRKAYWMKKSVGILELLTPAQLLNATAGVTMHAGVEYLKDTVNGVTDTNYDPFWDVYTAPNEPTQVGMFFKRGSSTYRARGVHQESGGFRLAQCDEVDSDNIATATLPTAGVYDPITDTMTSGSTTALMVLLEPSKFYRYATKTDEKYNSGDLFAVTLTNVPAGNLVNAKGRDWRVMNSQPELDAWVLHLRAA